MSYTCVIMELSEDVFSFTAAEICCVLDSQSDTFSQSNRGMLISASIISTTPRSLEMDYLQSVQSGARGSLACLQVGWGDLSPSIANPWIPHNKHVFTIN